ncbi:tetratricopeptide repeat protein [Kibdelosporangium banguiense]|uniref:tetratricopeptide repeat protein n=1 Tax=Kibdelosporangium banguiense TaxID=1365924 RepID=UPI001FD95D6B|nr:tetratricopeptide repeat protein [Kibdelosporangium banguiense]
MQRHHDNTEGAAATLDSLGWIDHRTGDHHRAIHHYTQALILFRDLGNTFQAANTLDNLAHPHLALGDSGQARLTWQEAFELYRQQGRDQDAERVRRHLDELERTGEPADPWSRPVRRCSSRCLFAPMPRWCMVDVKHLKNPGQRWSGCVRLLGCRQCPIRSRPWTHGRDYPGPAHGSAMRGDHGRRPRTPPWGETCGR